MPLDTGQLTALVTALSILVGALSTAAASRTRRIQRDQRALKRSFRQTQRIVTAALRHIFAVEQRLAARGIEPPPRPVELEQFYDDDPGEDPDDVDTAGHDDDPDRAATGDPDTPGTRRRRHRRRAE